MSSKTLFTIPAPAAINAAMQRHDIFTMQLEFGSHQLEILTNSTSLFQKLADHFNAMRGCVPESSPPKRLVAFGIESPESFADQLINVEFSPLHEETRQDWLGRIDDYKVFYQEPDLLSYWRQDGETAYLVNGRICDHHKQNADCVTTQQASLAFSNFHMVCDHIYLLIAQLEGAICFHGACAKLGEKVVLLTGESGAGKSTTALSLLRDGAQLLTDEIVLLVNEDQRVKVFGLPITPMLVGENSTDLALLESSLGSRQEEKSPVDLSGAAGKLECNKCFELDAMLCLGQPASPRAESHRLVPLGEMEAFELLNSQILGYNSVQSASKRMQYLLDLVSQTAAYKFFPGTSISTLYQYLEKEL